MVLPEGHTRGRHWEVGATISHQGHREVIAGIHTYSDSGLLFGHALEGGLVSVQGPCRPLSHTKWVLPQQHQK